MLIYLGMATKQKVGISERALIQRINRKLKSDNQKLCTQRYWRDGSNLYENSNLGRYYVIDVYRNYVVDHHVDIEDMGRKLGVFAPWEELAQE